MFNHWNKEFRSLKSEWLLTPLTVTYLQFDLPTYVSTLRGRCYAENCNWGQSITNTAANPEEWTFEQRVCLLPCVL
jgi:hypothetical protein